MDNTTLPGQTIALMKHTVDTLASGVPKPVMTTVNGHPCFRYKEQTIHQAVILKLARMVSNLNAAQLLLTHGFVQEQGALQRMLEEGNEDITFLTLAIICDDVSDLHTRYLNAFWEEEFDSPSPMKSTQKRPNIPRKSINAWIARNELSGIDESTGVALTTTIHKMYSGYVHGASPHIMDLYGGNPARFHMNGMLGTTRHAEHADDLLNYFYRGIVAFAFAAKAFGDNETFDSIREYSIEFSKLTGLG